MISEETETQNEDMEVIEDKNVTAEFGNHISYCGTATADVAVESELEIEVLEPELEVVENDVQILGVSEEILEDGTVVAIGQVHIDGNETFYIDLNGDETFDVVAADLNHDGVIGEGEYVDIQDAYITVEDFDPNMGMDEDLYWASNNDAPTI